VPSVGWLNSRHTHHVLPPGEQRRYSRLQTMRGAKLIEPVLIALPLSGLKKFLNGRSGKQVSK
jgi:hypothetical protein